MPCTVKRRMAAGDNLPRLSSDLTLVCGGGGVWGIAWMTGIVAGLADAGLDLRCADRFVGTSAGSVVAAQLLGDLSIDELYARQTEPAEQAHELIPPDNCLAAITAITRRSWANQHERLRALCRLSLEAETVGVLERRASIADRLAPRSDSWGDGSILLTAVNVDRQIFQVFDSDSGVSLIDAVAASCAVPGVWPAVQIGDDRYADGGIWSTAENAHLAQSARKVIILSPMANVGTAAGDDQHGLAADVARLQAEGALVLIIAADGEAIATMNTGPLDPSTRAQAAQAGRLQARSLVPRVRDFFSRA